VRRPENYRLQASEETRETTDPEGDSSELVAAISPRRCVAL